ncbi:hypothetical protein ABZ468_46205 [Streptomyces sp. NPDC005708]|uniref:hypothetical protein n=1 Tax=unclassified Streptomyces TaxID=2593676 RepID=UPI0033FF8B8A
MQAVANAVVGLEGEPAGHLAELASASHAAYVQVAAGLPDNSALEVVGGRLKLARLTSWISEP